MLPQALAVKYYALLAIERFVSGVESMAPFSQPHFHPIAPILVLGVVFQTKE
ncbi:hypothetical protein COO91_08192 [Nostoc flagelliforme CCNUN1]|uniref:Uncharacterized protein n=1 Tax=Nostoc flagelliforme CCNUN1 TaxID=2038116 RepID=A0A2K8T310_9NOSO|nr:hypothetical protein COO91_08192 [Nostoc flagelliforme CCNUN1]